ncbi:MAG: RagB/SusD family nutrient uptake outer membrane protein [Sphingobacteriaceae bacterium]|nr:MAG: RagB/SusD family nutrient uptake outer membrane protein [Sphingobacteriaceae bacterium]
MKNISKITILFLSMFFLSMVSCKKSFLDRPPLDQITFDNFYKTDADLRRATGALYGTPWFDFNDKALNAFGDAMSGNLARTNWTDYSTFAVSSGDSRSNEAWRSLYKIIAYCNLNIIYINENSGTGVTAVAKNNALGELRFLRATAYFYLVQLFGSVPIITDNRTLADQPLVNRNIVKDVYRFIIEDMTFAARNLRTVKDAGRVNKWSAEGMLAKIYLTRSGLKDDGTGVNGTRSQSLLDSAKFYAGDVCKNSALALVPNYDDLFKIANNNNDESLFAFQWISSTTYGVGNSFQGYFAAESKLTGVGDGFGGANTPSINIYEKYTAADTRRKSTFMRNGDVYPELLQSEGGYKVTELSPHVKKYVVGTPADNMGKVAFLSTGMNTYILRLADVYLLYAEAILGNNTATSDPDAVNYYNMVRRRAGLTIKAAPITKADILLERRLELAMEGQYWYDLLRQHDVNPAATIQEIGSQDRGRLTYDASTNTTIKESVASTPTEASFKLQYPAADVITNPKLLDPAVAYYN